MKGKKESSTNRRKNSKSKESELTKPSADNLEGYPKLQKKLSKVEGKPHPIDTKNVLVTFTLSYLKPYYDLARNLVVTQRCHFQLPKEDQVIYSTNKIGAKMYEASIKGESKKTLHSELKVDDLRTPKHSILISLVRAYWPRLTWLLFLYVFYSGMNFGVVYFTKEGLTELTRQMDAGGITDKIILLKYFGAMWFLNFAISMLMQWLWVQGDRMVLRLAGSAYTLIYLKLLRIGIVNPHEHDEGSIINYLQTDISTFNNFTWTLGSISMGTMNLILSVALGLVYFNYVFFVLVIGLAFIGIFNTLILKKIMRLRKRKQEATDKRINLLKNVLKNVNFIKINAFENLFVRKVNEARKDELKKIVFVKLSWMGVNMLYSLGTPMVIVGFLYAFFQTGGALTVASVTILLRIFNLLEGAMFQLPAAFSTWTDMIVSVNRINLFLESKELNYHEIRAKIDMESEDAVKIENGRFYWDKKLSKEEAEKIRKEKLKVGKKVKKAERRIRKMSGRKVNKDKSFGSDSDASILRQTLLSHFTSESVREKQLMRDREDKFEMTELNFRAKRGELTVLIGKIGSGKSTLLYSILGETMIKNTFTSKVHINGTVSFLGQNPWLLNATVKENVILNKEFDQEQFDWALKYSALIDDIETWDNKENQEIGESGSSLSGGQRARIALARCLYQE